MAEEQSRRWSSLGALARATALVASVVIAFALIVAVVWIASTAVITILVAILFAVLFDAAARALGRLLPLNRRLRLLIVFVLAVLGVLGAAAWGGSVLAGQLSDFYSSMRMLLLEANHFLSHSGLGASSHPIDLSHLLSPSGPIIGGAETVVSTVGEFLTLSAAVLVLGAFLSWEPDTYKSIVLSLLPRGKRARVSEVLDLAAHALREWLIGRAIIMAVIFGFTISALFAIGMPYAALLGVQAGLLTFIPTLGPFLAGVVIVLAGLSQSLHMAIYGLAVYVIAQFLESHVVTPLVQRRTIRLPPAATLGLQVIAYFLFGLFGIAFAVPIAAAGRVLIRELYVNDQLGGEWEPESSSHQA